MNWQKRAGMGSSAAGGGQERRLEKIPDHAQESGLDFKGKPGQLIRCALPGWDGR